MQFRKTSKHICETTFHFIIDSRTGFYLKKYGVEQKYLSAYHYTRNVANEAYTLVIFNPSVPYQPNWHLLVQSQQ